VGDAVSEGTGADEGLVYSYRPRMVGAGSSYRLGPHSLEWNLGGYPGQVSYPMIDMIRLGYRPSNFGNRRFVAEIWSRKRPKLEIASSSFKSMVSMEDQGAAYRVFIQELHRRVAESGGNCRFEAGFAAWRWWPMVAISIATAGALAYVFVTTLGSGDLGTSALVVGFAGLFVWQMWPLIFRNRPEPYDPRNIPDRVMP
jgi:hypothetical protein